ncbi:hypothetical protein [Bailinhaonella thermotolerans]|uniref:Cytochrome P450 n=1 Tax=Bailinhaonella thermotolerans TaxID=1070861 RepID=A0A3A4B0E7_9ACTN|nr:hypothetical protein [Bailinhaonella thermotolerans]RJL30930.1 hypothetical protein D5H75_21810 [Bailinhaonella thermotolerans]
MVTLKNAGEVRAVLADARFAVPVAPPGGRPGTMAWLRASVSRWSEGEAHARRRALAVAELDRLDPAALRRTARERAAAMVCHQPEDVARTVPVTVLAEALDLRAGVRDVADVAAAYFPGAADDVVRRADAAVARLVAACTREDAGDAGGDAGAAERDGDGVEPGEAVAARIAVLVQAYDSTAALILNALKEGGVGEALERDPPLKAMRRVAAETAELDGRSVEAGTEIVLDLVASGETAFGTGRRPCPGREQAIAIAEGVLEALR